MSNTNDHDLTRVLRDLGNDDDLTADRVLPLVYDELRALAAKHLAMETPGHTLQATALVHEVYIRMVDQRLAKWTDRAHFIAVAAKMIRRILVDHARGRKRAKRGGAAKRIMLSDAAVATDGPDVDLVALDNALHELSFLHERQARVVELRFFGGMTVEETAHVLGVSARTVKADWHVAQAWLRLRLTDGEPT